MIQSCIRTLKELEEKLLGVDRGLKKAQDEKKELEEKINHLEIENIRLNREKIELEKENSIFKESLKKEEEKNRYFEKNIGEALEIYQKYNLIDGELKNELREIFKGNSFQEFIFCGVQLKNIELLWEISKNSIFDNNKDSKKVADIFHYFFNAINRTYEKPVYRFLEISFPLEPFLVIPYTFISLDLNS